MNPRIGLFCLWCAWGGGGVSMAWAERSRDFDHPNSYIGNAGWEGGLELWMEIGELPIGPGISLPMRLRLASTSPRPEALLGSLFWCPVLESTLSHSEGEILEFTTLGGAQRFLPPSPGGGFVSLNGRVSARLEGNFTEVQSEGWRYRYSGGKIHEAVSPDGTSLFWIYQKGQISGLGDSRGERLLAVTRTDHGVVLSGRMGTFQFRGGEPDAAGALRWRLSFPDGREEEIILASEGPGITRLDIRSPGLEDRTYRWKSDSGALLSDGDFTYEARPTDMGFPVLHKIDRSGRTEWYVFDAVKGMAVYKRQDGSRVISWYHEQPGATYRKVFRMDSISAEGRLMSSRRLSHDVDGNLLQEWTEPGEATSRIPAADLRYIDLQEARRLHRQPGVLFVDARKPSEYSRGHISGARRLSRSQFATDFASVRNLLAAAASLVVYCSSRQCEDSCVVATQLWQRGWRHVLIFEGGWEEWRRP